MYQVSRKHPIRILLATLLLASIDLHASQILSGSPDETLSASVSRAEPTLIRIDGHRIRRIFGAEGDFTVTPDKESGTAYIKPAADKTAFSAFISDDAGRTWKLLLSVTDGPSDSIIIKGRHQYERRPGHDFERNRTIKHMILELESDEDNGASRKVNEIVPLWQESLFVLVKVIDGQPIRGEKYQLTNVSDKLMVIDERELYRPGVVAVSVEKPELRPAETTAVYVVLEGDK